MTDKSPVVTLQPSLTSGDLVAEYQRQIVVSWNADVPDLDVIADVRTILEHQVDDAVFGGSHAQLGNI
jgi:hypothetical protein